MNPSEEVRRLGVATFRSAPSGIESAVVDFVGKELDPAGKTPIALAYGPVDRV